MRFFLQLLLNALAIMLCAYLFPNKVMLVGFGAAVIVAIVLALLNTLLKPILMLFALPVNFMTFGLFTLVINACIIMLASNLTMGFQVDGFVTALLFSIALSIISSILFAFFGIEQE